MTKPNRHSTYRRDFRVPPFGAFVNRDFRGPQRDFLVVVGATPIENFGGLAGLLLGPAFVRARFLLSDFDAERGAAEAAAGATGG